MKLFKGLCIFGAGVIAGAFVAARAVKEKYQQEAEEEIAEMREYYRELTKNAKTPDEDKMLEEDEKRKEEKEENTKNDFKPIEELEEAKEIIKDKGYINYTHYNDTDIKENKREEQVDENEIYIIDPEEYGGENGEYDTATLTYFKDGVLADEVDEIVAYNIIGGEENLQPFKDYPDCNAVYVRDDNIMVDYEILRDPYQYDEYKMDFSDDRPPHQL